MNLIKQKRRAVLDLSVYNALRAHREPQAVPDVVSFLRVWWKPAWAKVGRVVTERSVRLAAERLEARGLVKSDGHFIDCAVRDSLGRGRPVGLNFERTEIAA